MISYFQTIPLRVFHYYFLPMRRSKAGLCQSNVSVRVSVRYVQYCMKTDLMVISSPSDSPTI